jgi:hypothetical protein
MLGLDPAPVAHALQMHTRLRASSGIASSVAAAMVTWVHQHGVESVATPQSLDFPHSGQVFEESFSMAATAN